MTDINLLLFTLNAIAFAAVFMFTFVAAIFLHELGHLLVLRKHSKKARVHFNKVKGKLKITAGKEADYLQLTPKELNKVYIGGIFLGLVPVCLFTLVSGWGLILIIVYLAGCNSDFKKLNKLI